MNCGKKSSNMKKDLNFCWF